MIQKLAYLFGSKTKAQEILLLQNDVKDVVRHGFYQEQLPRIKKYCQEKNLHFVQSKFKVLLVDNSSYSNKGLRVPENDKRSGIFFTYISKDEEKSYLAAYYELMGNDKDLGKILGYPECCINFFAQNFSAKNPNPQHLPTNAWTNLTKREQDAVLISHFPCSSDCQQSINIARNNTNVLMNHDKEHTRELLTKLKVH